MVRVADNMDTTVLTRTQIAEPPEGKMNDSDPYAWLEAVDSERALDWARAQNARTLVALQAHPLFEPIHRRNREILMADDRIDYPEIHGGYAFNFWRDATHERGIWRRSEIQSYCGGSPSWDVLLDVDCVAADEGRNWVWAGAQLLRPSYDRALIPLSIGGADATVYREFDLERRRFVEGGFTLPESKSRLAWRDGDSVFAALALTEDQLTDSGYPRQVRIWRRGDPLAAAEFLFAGERGDVSVSAMRIWDGDDHYDLLVRAPEFFRREYHLVDALGRISRLTIPDDAMLAGIVDGQALIRLKSAWQVRGSAFAAGALVSAPLASLLTGLPRLELLHAPGERSAISDVATTRSTVLISILDNVVGRLLRFERRNGRWERGEVPVPELGTVTMIGADDRSDHALFSHTGFLTPARLFHIDRDTTPVRSEPVWFDTNGMTVSQYEATSRDGTKIPYFLVAPAGFVANARNPTLLSAYGGFEVARTPIYSGVLGTAWLEHGGVYVLANIRGGGEFGPRWHQAARKENRQRAYDDFIAVAEDLIARRITSPEHLGIQGGSNGGLLVGAAFTQRPELFNAVVCQVPLLDMRRYHRLLAGASWMAEYGDPDDPDQWHFISGYSPLHNVSATTCYPQVLFTTSTRDDRVHPGHARKMAAKMQALGHDVLYYENIEGGHGGAANLAQTAFVQALVYAYLHGRLAMDG
jgi:prolyl oligopeptidase